ncbi:hypothetical protein P5705_00725 [Pseudomonas entomophila]|uniref:hypothetical protein n=1 Tax=Pseudomonas entomophila TaxID=312306 RepID=UPI00240749DC|nr:hypothetical protein [Pseudomonas entomophila]MDF9616157.1 hypothetical protein [Pseudomonas entomophila]
MGLEVFAEGNRIQLGGSKPLLSLVYKRTIALDTWVAPLGSSGMYSVDITLPRHGLILLGDTGGEFISVEYGLGGRDVVRFASANPVVITFFVFGNSPISSSTWGLQSYSAQGELLYDSSHKALRIAYVGPAPKDSLSFSALPGNTYAAGLSFYRRYYLIPPFNAATFVHRDTIRVAQGKVSIGRRLAFIEDSRYAEEMFFEANQGPALNDVNPASQLIIATVSGY